MTSTRHIPIIRSLKRCSMSLWSTLRTRIFPCKPATSPSLPARHPETSLPYNAAMLSRELPCHPSQLQPDLDRGVPSHPYRGDLYSCRSLEEKDIATGYATGDFTSDPGVPGSSPTGLEDSLRNLPPPKRSRPRPLSRSLVVAWKHVSANLRLQDTHVEEMELVSSNFVIVEATSFSMSTHSLPISPPNSHNPSTQFPSQAYSYDRSESFLEFSD